MKLSNPTFFFTMATIKLVLLALIGLFLGSELLSVNQVWEGLFSTEKNTTSYILYELRIPRILTSIFIGAALSLSGLMMQTYFRNALAGPYILGVSAGSGLGIAVFTMLGALIGYNFADLGIGITFAGIVGGFSILLLVSLMSRYIGNGSMLLIVGLMLGSFASAAVGLLQYFSASEAIKKYLLWTFGSLNSVTMDDLLILIPIIFVIMVFTLFFTNSLNALLLGESEAQSLGISIKRDKLLLLLLSGTLAALVTVYCGPIAFIGLAAPHLSRMMLKTVNHKILIPASILTGALLLLFCDIIAQLPGSDMQLPINAVTSIIGAPLVIYIIFQNRTLNYE
jgi:iron complex transport system permease protein